MNIYLIQRGEIRHPLGEFRKCRLSQAVELDYMGSAEFEFGALPKSFRAIEANLDKATLRIVPEIVEEDRWLRVFSTLVHDEWTEYLGLLQDLRADKRRTKEISRFAASYPKGQYTNTDFWWDIQNHVMFSFNKQFMNHIHKYVAASLDYMNEAKA